METLPAFSGPQAGHLSSGTGIQRRIQSEHEGDLLVAAKSSFLISWAGSERDPFSEFHSIPFVSSVKPPSLHKEDGFLLKHIEVAGTFLSFFLLFVATSTAYRSSQTSGQIGVATSACITATATLDP